jgi:putative ABC transport system ATP-binding protein
MNSGNGVMVQAIGLTKRYGTGHSETYAVRDVSLAIPGGQFWIVSGPSGSGKTTLLGLLAGMIAPTCGEVRLCGEPITHLRDHHRALVRRHLVGVVFQECALVPRMTVGENLFLPLVPEGGATESDRLKAGALLERFGMAEFARARVERLSAGERQRAAIIRALLADAPILLLDEPTASLDTDNVRMILDVLLRLRDEGRTLLATTHDQRLAEHPRIDGVLRLVDGTIRE